MFNDNTTNDIIMYENDFIREVKNEVSQVIIKRNHCSIGTWNVRTLLQTRKLENLKIEIKLLK